MGVGCQSNTELFKQKLKTQQKNYIKDRDMSRWMGSVNNILNQLDGQVENVASNASTVPEVSSAATVDAILNKRGLSNVVEEENNEKEENEEEVEGKYGSVI